MGKFICGAITGIAIGAVGLACIIIETPETDRIFNTCREMMGIESFDSFDNTSFVVMD